MATREENLQKINLELEKLDDEQLDSITGSGVQILPLLIKSIPVVAPIIIEEIEKNAKSNPASPVVDLNDPSKTKKNQVKPKVHNTGDPVPQFDLSK